MSNSTPTFIAAGLMSGTSMDGIDASLLITNGEDVVQELANTSLEYDSQFKLLLKAGEWAVLQNNGNLSQARQKYIELAKEYFRQSQSISHVQAQRLFDDLSFYFHKKKNVLVSFDEIIERSTDLHAQLLHALLKETKYQAKDIDIIGYHGQTLFHRPSNGITIQIGNGQRLADEMGIAVAYDFRSNDVKHGGQGAPFAPLYHQALARQSKLAPVIVVNCGGISNITAIASADEELYAYDCGPGNNLIDRFVQLKVGKKMDIDGQYGSKGTVVETMMAALKEKAIIMHDGSNYLNNKPPKSLDASDLTLISEVNALSLEDGCATLEAFTADCIIDSIKYLPFVTPKLWIISGGGSKNKVIVAQLEQRLQQKLGSDMRVQPADQVGWNSKAIEAQVFAYLAVRALRKLPLSLPGTTGVPKPLSGGKIVFPVCDLQRASQSIRSFFDQA